MAFGRLERSKGTEPMSDINMTPLIDVMLVLVVIFILTAPLLASSIRLDLPKTDAAKGSSGAPFVTLVLTSSGQLYLNDKPVAADALVNQLTETAANAPDTEVQLRADAAVPYGRVVEVMGLAQKAGLNRIGFVADTPTPPKR
jgi:biopolymer transport protein TolR